MIPADATARTRSLRDAAAMLDIDRQTMRPYADELSAQEMRAVRAVLRGKQRQIPERAEAGRW